jgi:hypothetical protein
VLEPGCRSRRLVPARANLPKVRARGSPAAGGSGPGSEKQGATPTFKRTFGFHPLLAFLDHGSGGTGDSLAALLRPGRAAANDAADHIEVLTAALCQLPVIARRERPHPGAQLRPTEAPTAGASRSSRPTAEPGNATGASIPTSM